MTLTDLRTPSVLIDQPRALRNIDRMVESAARRGIRLRPHAKTHKSPQVARWQLDRGAVGICCAKLGEAEVFADAGIADIRLPYPLNPANADRVVALARRVRLSFVVDHAAVARAWSEALSRAGVRVDVLVKIDVGFHRCGIDPDPATAVPFVQMVSALPGLRLAGLLSHAGQSYHAASAEHLRHMAASEATTLQALAAACRRAGVAIDELSAGATPTARYSLEQDGLTEYRAGNFVYYDRTQVGLGAATLDDCALTVLARVVSKPTANRLVLDAGSKTLSSDAARGFSPAPGYGVILANGVPGAAPPAGTAGPDARRAAPEERSAGTSVPASPDDSLVIERLSEEHAVVTVATGTTPLEPGDLVRIVPNHACVVSNLVDVAWLMNDAVVAPLPIVARGRIA